MNPAIHFDNGREGSRMREENLAAIQQNSKEIASKLEDIIELISNMRDSVKTASSDTQTADMFKSFLNFVDKCEDTYGKLIKDVKFLIETPVFIGVIGKYSHGKSSLINAILKRPGKKAKDAEIMPTGDNIVTATPSAISFTDGNDVEFRTDIDSQPISLKEFQSIATSQNSNIMDSIFVDYGVGSDPLLKDFQENNIRIVDTPGLGGPYFNDTVALTRWTERFGMALVIIKATDITAETANTVKLFLADFHKPILIVVTYWDAWNTKGSPYSECNNSQEARKYARTLINQHFGKLPGFSVEELANSVTFVSTKMYIENENELNPIDVSEYYDDFSSSWNIDYLKKTISNFARDKTDLMEAGKTMSPLIKDKLNNIKDSIVRADKEMRRLESELFNAFSSNQEIANNNVVRDEIEDFKSNVKKEWGEAGKRFEKDIRALAQEIKTSPQYDSDVASQFNNDCKNAFEENFGGKLLRKRKAIHAKLKSRLEKILRRDFNMSPMELKDALGDDYSFLELEDDGCFLTPLQFPRFSVIDKINPFSKQKPRDIMKGTIAKWEEKNIRLIKTEIEEHSKNEEEEITSHFAKLVDKIDEAKYSINEVNVETVGMFKKIKETMANIKSLID
jgi:predicted GTPase